MNQPVPAARSTCAGRTLRWCSARCALRARPPVRSWPGVPDSPRRRSARSSPSSAPVAPSARTSRPHRDVADPDDPSRSPGESIIGLGFEVNVDYLAAVALDLAGNTRISTIRQVETTVSPQRRRAARSGHARSTTRSPATGTASSVPRLPCPVWSSTTTARSRGHPTSAGTTSISRPSSRPPCGGTAPPRSTTTPTVRRWPRLHTGSRPTSQNSLYITGTVGIGAGIVHDGRLLRGGAGFAGEVGHMPIGDPSSSAAADVTAAGRRQSAFAPCSTPSAWRRATPR